ncbi:MAG: hypothetical protein KME35_05430 [Aphanocapsa sp. GSE-SYN-MK-11-07L]|jgi:hypothetical protein|nr:hypothetical protein [Aphanocapsa sp. GSE-SYN-MK-11-07L]
MTSQGTTSSGHKLAVNVLVKHEQEGEVSASVLGLPDFRVVSHDRASALAQLHTLLADSLLQGELVTMEVDLPAQAHPWAPFAGIYSQSQLFEGVLAQMETNRSRLNAQIALGEDV